MSNSNDLLKKLLVQSANRAQLPVIPKAAVITDSGEVKVTGVTKRDIDATVRQQESNVSAKKQTDNNEILKKLLSGSKKTPETALNVLAESSVQQANTAQTFNFDIQAKDDIILDASQEAALELMLANRFACLIGSAGTGKTTVTKRFVRRLSKSMALIRHKRKDANGEEVEEVRPPICFMAPTGKAVQQMKKNLPPEYRSVADTIHGHLGFHPEDYIDDNGKSRFRFVPLYTKFNKLPWKAVIIDEAGNLGIELWNQLYDALLPDCMIYLIGDINQLPPVMGHSVLAHAMTRWPVAELKTIHRQAADSPIIGNAHKILQGLQPKAVPGKFDIISLPDGSIDARQKILTIMKRLYTENVIDPVHDTLISGYNEGDLGQAGLNDSLIGVFNPPQRKGNIVVNPRQIIDAGRNKISIAAGDKVMLLANDRTRMLSNGMVGIVESIVPNGTYRGEHFDNAGFSNIDIDEGSFDTLPEFDFDNATAAAVDEEEENQQQASHITTIRFIINNEEHQLVEFATRGQYKKMGHAYAVTCHKMQGSEGPIIIIILHASQKMTNFREWLYTAVTRAQSRVILLCNERGLQRALHTQKITGSTVQEKAKQFMEMSGKPGKDIPNLPAATART